MLNQVSGPFAQIQRLLPGFSGPGFPDFTVRAYRFIGTSDAIRHSGPSGGYPVKLFPAGHKSFLKRMENDRAE